MDRPVSIVDYADGQEDNVAKFPEHEDGESLGMTAGGFFYGEELAVKRDYSNKTHTVNSMTQNNQVDSPQMSAQADFSQPESVMKESEAEFGGGGNRS